MTWILLTVVVVATALSDILQSYEMKRAGAQSVGARGMGRLLRMIVERRYLLLSIVCLAFSFFAFMAWCNRRLSALPYPLRPPVSFWKPRWRSFC